MRARISRMAQLVSPGLKVLRRDGLRVFLKRLKFYAATALKSFTEAGFVFPQNRPPAFSPASLMAEAARAQKLACKPRVCVIVPVYGRVRAKFFTVAVESVLGQVYPEWELLIVHDPTSGDHLLREAVHRAPARDRRIKVIAGPVDNPGRGVFMAMNAATCSHIAFLGAEDGLAPTALLEGVVEFNAGANLVYSDSDKITDAGKIRETSFKPGWSPEHLLRHNYIDGLIAIGKNLAITSVRTVRESHVDLFVYAMLLRAAHLKPVASHVPETLYHRRLSKNRSPDIGEALRVVKESLAERGLEADVSVKDPGGLLKIDYAPPKSTPLVSVIIPAGGRRKKAHGREVDLLANLLASVNGWTTYPSYEVVVVHDGNLGKEAQDACGRLGDRLKLVHYDKPFNFSEKVNLGAASARGEYLLLLNDDMKVITPDWIERMLAIGRAEDVGAVGARLLFDNETLQHAGVVALDNKPSHLLMRYPKETAGPGFLAKSPREVIAVTGACMLVRKTVFDGVGGFSPDFPSNYNDVDFCLKLKRDNHRVVIEPDVTLYHYESASRDKSAWSFKELERLVAKWGYIEDPFYNPNFSLTAPSCQPRGSLDNERLRGDYLGWILRRITRRRHIHPKPKGEFKISILTPVYNPPKRYLDDLADSALRQTYGNFEWVIVDNGSEAPTRRRLEEIAASDSRVKLTLNGENMGIIRGTRMALERATGDYYVTLDHDDLLYHDALWIIASSLEKNPGVECFYSDEDKHVEDRLPKYPFLKPDWDPAYLSACCYIAHLSGARRDIALELGAYTDPAAEGSHDWDTFMRFVRRGARPLHIREPLYSWRIHERSTAGGESVKPYAVKSQEAVLNKHLALTGKSGAFGLTANPLAAGMWRVTMNRGRSPLVTLVIGGGYGGARLSSALAGAHAGYKKEAVRLIAVGVNDEERQSASNAMRNIGVESASSIAASFHEAATQAGRLASSDGSYIAFVSSALDMSAGFLHELAAVLEYFDDSVLAGGRILDRRDVVLWAGGCFGFGGFIGSPDSGIYKFEPGYAAGAVCHRTVDGVSPLMWMAKPALVTAALGEMDGADNPALFASRMALTALCMEKRVIYTPYASGISTVKNIETRPAETPMEDVIRACPSFESRPRYYHPLFSTVTDRPYALVDEMDEKERMKRLRFKGYHE